MLGSVGGEMSVVILYELGVMMLLYYEWLVL